MMRKEWNRLRFAIICFVMFPIVVLVLEVV